MTTDHYAVLGVGRNASPEEIQSAYRQLARKYHPDLNPDDNRAKQQFQDVQNAFDVLNDPQKREMYDRYGSDFESIGAGRPGPQAWPGAGGEPGGGPSFDVNLDDLFGARGSAGGGFADIFKQFSQRGKQQQRRTTPTRGASIEHALTVPFTTAVLGGEAQIAVRRGDGTTETLQVKIPPGIESGQKIRLRGQGESSIDGGPSGDILIKVSPAPHPHFRRQGKRLVPDSRVRLHLPSDTAQG